MTTSFEEIQRAEEYILAQLSTEDRLVFEAQVLTNPALRMDVYFQKKVYQILRLFTRRDIKQQLEMMHERIFNDPAKADFKQSILKFFNP